MTIENPHAHLIQWCHRDTLNKVRANPVSIRNWFSEFKRRVSALDPGALNEADETGLTVLGWLANYEPATTITPMIDRAATHLLAANANPLSGKSIPLMRGASYCASSTHALMLKSLIEAQRAGTPLRPDHGGGNLLHALVDGGIGCLQHLVKDQLSVLSDAGDVLAVWRDETNDDGRTPVDLAWEWYFKELRTRSDGQARAIWSLLCPGENGVWQPPSLDAVCADGDRFYDRIQKRVDQGLKVPSFAEGVFEQARALAQRADFERNTPQVSVTGARALRL